jgi:hypothetical protein
MTCARGIKKPAALTTPTGSIIQTPMDKSDEDKREVIKRLEAWGQLFYGRNATRTAPSTFVGKVSAFLRRLVRKADDA